MNNKKYLDLDALIYNLEQYKDKKICAMVKANAYGHGIKEIVTQIKDKVDSFGVVSIEEGKQVRAICDNPILICSKVFDLRACKRYGLDTMIENEDDLKICIKEGLTTSLHLKINCGMNRFGNNSELGLKMINEILQNKNIRLKSIYTHLPRTNSKHQVRVGIKRFEGLKRQITQTPPICLGGSGVHNYNINYDILRLGIGMYGYGDDLLKPVMKITSKVLKVFYAMHGEYIGYGKAYKVQKDGFFAIVGIGYGDGLRRNLSGKIKVKINGRGYQTVGNICMDALFIEADDKVVVGDEVEIMANADVQAKILNTIPYEILTGFGTLRGKTILVKEK